MALTPEDVVNKRFNPTKFREGYDQDEVDDFLDEVVVELRRLNQENEELRQRLVAGDARIQELQSGAPAAAAAAAPAPAPVVAAPIEPVLAAPAPVAAPAATPSYDMDDPGSTNNLLQLARRLHEEHVREGMEKRDALIAEGHATAARLVSEAQETQRTQLGALESERDGLERQIDELRTFEGEYRAKLKSYIQGQLEDLDAGSVATSAGSPASAAIAVPPVPPQQAAPAPEPAYAAPAPEPAYAAPAPQQAEPAWAQPAAPAPAQPEPAYGAPRASDYPAYPAPQPAAYPQAPQFPGFGSGN